MADSERRLSARIFVSPDEPRLRAGWRFLIHSIGYFIVIMAVNVIATIIFYAVTAAQGREIPADSVQAQVDFLFSSPFFLMLNGVGSAIGVTLITWLVRRFIDRRTFASLGLHLDHHTATDLFFGVGLGALLMAIIFVIHWASGWLTFEGWIWQSDPDWWSSMLVMLLFFLAVGFYEELLSRGYHLQTIADGTNLMWGVILSILIFSLLHLPSNPGAGWRSFVGILVAGLFLALGWIRTRQLWISIGLHIGWNFFQGPVFGFPVSGTTAFSLMIHKIDGPEILTGGQFGPEAGLTGLFAIIIGSALIWWYTRDRDVEAYIEAANTRIERSDPDNETS